MKRFLSCTTIIALLIGSCTAKKRTLLNPKNLQSSFIKIVNDSTYHLKTAKGAIVNIPANCFDVPAGSTVDIEIKEAYSIQDILKAGLTTMSNGKLLQSGGMIFFNATVDNKPVKFLKEVGLTIPSKVYNDSMKVFKRELTADSTINWVEPKPVDSSDMMKSIESGKWLFKANCANCHKPLEPFTGPPLAGSRLRAPSSIWPYRFVTSVNSMLETDLYAKELLAKYGSKMTQFNGLKAIEIKNIFDYCDNEAALYQPSFLKNSLPAYDTTTEADYIKSLCYDTVSVLTDTGFYEVPEMDDSIADTTGVADYTANVEVPMYSFNIDQSGWYNIDCFIAANEKEVTPVSLTTTLSEDGFADDIQVYLCLPDKKLLIQGYIDENKLYTFAGGDSIQLILNARAFVFAIGKKHDQLYYGINGFKVADKQAITIKLFPTTDAKIKTDLKMNKIQDVKFDMDRPVIQSFIKTDSANQQIDKQVIERRCDQPVSDSTKAVSYF